jgi:hypothetical protein
VKVQLRYLAHARSGDKGDMANVGLIALKPELRILFISGYAEEVFENSLDHIVGVNTLLSRKRYAVLHLRERLQSIHDEFAKK